VLVEEVIRQWQPGPTHVFVQAGVGGLAAAVFGYLWARYEPRPLFIVVEPESADCWFQSNAAGKPTLASGNADTVMGGLACREISAVTWPVVGLAADWFMTIAEDEVLPARKLFAHPLNGDPAIVSGPSGCAGLAGLVRACTDETAFKELHLDRHSRVLVINSEGNLGEGAV
jgi:diaminopropionate ammonia-lyase